MHLKTLTIKGYKTYRDRTSIVDLHAGVNVFVGLNGSGKSNIYSAIRFALGGDRIASEQHRRSLLHQSHGRQVTSAYVELILDNSDGRIPIDKTEVALRRTITLKTDVYWWSDITRRDVLTRYHWDGKQATKSEVNTWLEAAGISTKNRTYYVVEQGEVTSLALVSDAKRLDLLKEVSGTRVYDLRRAESLAVIEKTNEKRRQTAEIIEEIRGKLKQLDSDQKDLQDYKNILNEKAALEVVIADRERQHYKDRIEKLEAETSRIQREFVDQRAVLMGITEELTREKGQLDTLRQEVEAHTAIGSRLNQRRSQLSIQYAELSAGYPMQEEGELTSYTEVGTIRGELISTKQEARCLAEEIEQQREGLAEDEERLRELRAEVSDLTRNHSKLVTEETDSNSLLDSQQKVTLEHRLASSEARYEELEELVEKQRHAIGEEKRQRTPEECIEEPRRTAQHSAHCIDSTMKHDMDKCEAEIEDIIENSARLQAELRDLNAEALKVSGQTRRTNRIISSAEARLKELRNSRHIVLDAIWQDTPPGTRGGYDIVMQANLEGVRGLLLEHIRVPEEYRLAVEITAGHQLYSILVDDEEVMHKCVDLVKARQAETGKPLRATFMYLARMGDREMAPEPSLSPVGSLLLTDVIKSPDWAECAVKEVWGKFLVADGETEHLNNHEFSLVTRGGDIFNTRGSLKGGFVDDGRYTRLKEWEKLYSIEDDIKSGETELENATARLMAEYSAEKEIKHRILGARVDLKRTLRAEALKARELSELRDISQRLRDSIYSAMRLTREYSAERDSLARDIAAITDELNHTVESVREPDDPDSVQLEIFKETLEKKKLQLAKNSQKVVERQSAIDKLRSRLVVLVEGRMQSLEERLRVATSTTADANPDALDEEKRIKWLTSEVTETEQELAVNSERLSELREAQSSKCTSVEDLEAEVADHQAEVATLERAHEEKMSELKVCEERRTLAGTKLDDIIAHQPGAECLDGVIRDLTEDTPTLRRRLLRCTRNLSKFGGGVNNKAAEQFGLFNGHYEELLQKQREMDEEQVAIDDLIRNLDAEKKDNVVKSFAQIDENFSNIFSILVPDGNARMKLLKRRHIQKDDEDSDSTTPSVCEEQYVGVALEVTFSRSRCGLKRIHEFSGGQKTVVAVALLFAMQKTDQPPFYLFDEIDAALDPQYREAVARLVGTVSNPSTGPPAQVICTTFHPELCRIADRHYRVSVTDGSSSVTVLRHGCQDII